jgi:hypothetical protein
LLYFKDTRGEGVASNISDMASRQILDAIDRVLKEISERLAPRAPELETASDSSVPAGKADNGEYETFQ